MKVIPLNNKTRGNDAAEQAKKVQTLDRALDRIKKDTGIDYRKLILGDQKEGARYKMRLHQDRMKETDDQED